MSSALDLRKALGAGLVVAPGAHDAVTARLVQEAGFPAGFLSGAALSAVRFGEPDLGYVGAAEVIEATRLISTSCTLPVIVDADTGYGGVLQVARTVRSCAAAGAAAVVLEDQVAPKRCGSVPGKAVVERSELAARLTAAVSARDAGADVLVVGRTDAYAIAGYEEALARATLLAQLGVDLVFVSGLTDLDELLQIATRTGSRLMANLSEAAEPDAGWPSTGELASVGVALAIVPMLPLLAAVDAMRDALQVLAAQGTQALLPAMAWGRFTDLLGLPAALDQEASFSRVLPDDKGST